MDNKHIKILLASAFTTFAPPTFADDCNHPETPSNIPDPISQAKAKITTPSPIEYDSSQPRVPMPPLPYVEMPEIPTISGLLKNTPKEESPDTRASSECSRKPFIGM